MTVYRVTVDERRRSALAKKNSLTQGRKVKADQLALAGQLAEALNLYIRVTELDRADVEAWTKRGITERRLGQFAESEASCRRAVALQPKLALTHYALGVSVQCLGRTEEAMTCYRAAIALDPKLPDAHYLIGNVLHGQGRLTEAMDHYRRAIALRSNYPEALSDLGAVLVLLGRSLEAEPLLLQALRLRPDNAETIANLGVVREKAGRSDEALGLFQRALRFAPQSVPVVACLASLLERQGKIVEAQQALDLVPLANDAALVCIRARIAREQGRPADAAALLEAALAGNARPADHILAAEMELLLGQMLDRLGEPAKAYGHIAAGKRHVAAVTGTDTAVAPRYLREVAKARRLLIPALGHVTPAADAAPAPIFLIGFPRSGTTLLEQILDSHPGLQAMEEKPAVAAMRVVFDGMAGDDPGAIAALEPEQIMRLRAAYDAEVRQHLTRRPDALLVDKLPLNIVWAHLIWRVFPDAKFLLALRHPCDVSLSCLMQNFGANEAMNSFLTLDHTVQTYAAVMSLWQEQTRVLPIQPHVLRYEDLVADFEPTVRGLLDFAGVGWDEAVLRHTDHARSRSLVNTPSYHQVREPIYKRATYRWKRYAEPFAPHMETLRPFIESFGYAEP